MSQAAIVETHLSGARLSRRGKVRELYDLGDSLLLVASDRISAYDCVLSPGVPDKGKVLTQLSNFWFRKFADVENHLIEMDVSRFPESLQADAPLLEGRSVIVRKAEVIPFECVARGYLAGSGWAEYRKTGAVCGVRLPPALVEADRLPEPIFTPATKADHGHDENIPFSRLVDELGEEEAGPADDHPRPLRAGAPVRRIPRPASRGHEARIRAHTTAACCGSTRPSRQTPPDSGTPGRGRRAGPPCRSTSSSFGTGSIRPAGTTGPRRPGFRKGSSARPARNTSRPIKP